MSVIAEPVEPGVARLRLSSWRGRVVGYEVSAYLIDGVLIDTGFPHVSRELCGVVKDLAVRGAIVTHWHEDHAGNAPLLAARGLPMRMHARCEATLRERPAIRAYRRVVWGRTSPLVAPLVDFDCAPLEVMSLPGHSPDHLVVWDAERRVLASGDLYLGVRVRVAHRSEAPSALLESLRAAAALEPRLLLDAHRGPVTNAAAKLRGKASWLEETIQAIVARRGSGDSSRAIARRLLGRETFVGVVSGGEYSKRAFVSAVLAQKNA